MGSYTIREMARKFGMQPSTLRYYEDQGLLTDVGRDDAGRRVYGDEHIGRLEAIACFKHAGMSIDELKRFFAYEGDERTHISDMVELLENRRDVIVEQRASLEGRICTCCASCICTRICRAVMRMVRNPRIGPITTARTSGNASSHRRQL